MRQRMLLTLISAFAVVCLSIVSSHAQPQVRFAVGAGLARGDTEGEYEGNGFYGTFGGLGGNGFLFRFAASSTDDALGGFVDLGFGPLPATADSDIRRLDVSAGFLFRKDRTVRPFVHGGLVFVHVEQSVRGTQFFPGFDTIDDSSTGLTYGVGLEVGTDHHAFYADINLDQKHEVEDTFGSQEIEIKLRDFHFGYLYRF